MEKAELIQAIALCIPILFLTIGRSKAQYAKGAKMALAWLGILFFVISLAAYWEDFKNTSFYTSLVTGEGKKNADGSLEFARADDGHFYINADVNGKEIKFMADTGASNIVLTKKDAEKIGIESYSLKYDQVFTTANGMTRGSSVVLPFITIGKVRLDNVRASVNEGELDSSLLGMSYLDRLKSYRVTGNKLILEP